jgi:hypothetical protein
MQRATPINPGASSLRMFALPMLCDALIRCAAGGLHDSNLWHECIASDDT